jgi:beta-phosphoglucomutase-like phosphatase (HAD superfamily)
MSVDAILFDFDGVLIESEAAGNAQLAHTLTELGHPINRAEAMNRFMGLSGPDFRAAVEGFIGGPIPDAFHVARRAEDERAMAEGVGEVAGAAAFVHALPVDLPIAVASSSSTHWIAAHLGHIGLRDRFGPHLYSGKEHVTRGKPAPDLYLHAAAALGVDIGRCVILEDSPVGVTGALASGATVIGVCAGSHCLPGHAAKLRALGVQHIADDFEEVMSFLATSCAS